MLVLIEGGTFHPIREEDSHQVRKLFGARRHEWIAPHGSPDRTHWKFHFDNDLIPPLWEQIEELGTNQLYYQVNQTEVEREWPSNNITKVEQEEVGPGVVLVTTDNHFRGSIPQTTKKI